MRAVIQRVREARVTVNKKIVGAIEDGLMILLGVGQNDSQEDIAWLVKKIVNMRIFSHCLPQLKRVTAPHISMLLSQSWPINFIKIFLQR